MTAAAAIAVPHDDWEPMPARAKLRSVVQVLTSGAVVLAQTWTWRATTLDRALQVSARPAWRDVIGQVDGTDPQAWMHAERILWAHGYRTAGPWTTFARMPVVLVERRATA